MPKTMEQVEDELAEVVERGIADTIGVAHADEDCEEIIGPPALLEFVVIAAWTDLTTGKTNVSRFTSTNLPSYRRDGLLHEALYEWG